MWTTALLVVGFAGPAFADAEDRGVMPGEEYDENIEAKGPETAYSVTLVGLDENPELQEILKASSQLFALIDRLPATLTALERRAEDDRQRLETALRSEGYYASEVRYQMEVAEGDNRITIEVDPGPRYRLNSYDIAYEEPEPSTVARPTLEEVGVELGMPARAPDVVAAEQKLVSLLAERGHPFARIADRKTFVRHPEQAMSVEVRVSAGQVARFGPLAVKGLSRVEEDYVRKLVGWSQGEPYNRTRVDETRRRLARTRLFSNIGIDNAKALDDQGELPMTLTVSEGKHRTIGASINYSTDVGPGGEVFWQHRNILGENENLDLRATGSTVEQIGEAKFRKPYFRAREQDLLVDVTGGHRDTDAYKQYFVENFVGLERPWLENWTIRAGLSPAYSDLDEQDKDDRRELYLLSLPLSAYRISTDDPLDPTSGSRLTFSIAPTGAVGSDELLFLKATAGGATYFALDSNDRFVLAARARLGSIVGESTEEVPADRRFYAGGGGSIRGYEFQKVGPLDSDNEPLGGRSLFEVGTEIRVRLTESIGIVPFIDGGTVFDSPYPDLDETVRWAAGLGLRYFTGFGPLRLDVAFPLNSRNDVDDDFQFYVSFGQAF